ncbi:MAG: hypothetical protein AB7I04_20725 [Pseudomonadales bacterium]
MISPSLPSIGRSLLRLVFRGGSPERIRYSDRLLLVALLGTLLTTIVSQRWFFQSSLIGTGLTLFTLYAGAYLGAAIIGRRIPRMRVRSGMQAFWLLLLGIQLLLILLIPIVQMLPQARTGVAVVAGMALIAGTTSIVHYLQRGGRLRAAVTSVAFFAVLGAFHAILSNLLEVLFG